MSVRCALVQTRLCPCNPHFAASTPPFSLTRQRFASSVSLRTGRGLGRLVAYVTEMQTEATVGELLIVGPGVLGSYLGKLWIDKGGSVTGRTNTTNNHPRCDFHTAQTQALYRLKALGIAPQTYEDCGEHKFPNVVFCAPPSGSEDYAGSVRDAVGYWDGSGTFVFTSSTGVYPRTGLVTEDSPTVEMGKSERNDHILQAENAVLEVGCLGWLEISDVCRLVEMWCGWGDCFILEGVRTLLSFLQERTNDHPIMPSTSYIMKMQLCSFSKYTEIELFGLTLV